MSNIRQMAIDQFSPGLLRGPAVWLADGIEQRIV
jgi:hypothetical protein